MMATAGTAGRAGGFEIGLVMAGAMSAGAYTAGVVDFLIQALDQWHEGKRGDDPRCPRHDVSIKVMAGTSAGGMSVAIAGAQLCDPHTPAADSRPPGPSQNKLLRSWVRRIDIARLLATCDLDADPDGDVRSFLDSTTLDEIAAAVFRREDGPPPPDRSYLADPLHILLTVTNLQSIPFEVRFLGDGDRPPQMSMHGDHVHFALGKAPVPGPEIRPLLPGQYEDPQWKALAQSAMATGAFPLGFAPREISRKMAEYAGREWPIPGPVQEDGCIVRCGQFRKIPPDFPSTIRDDPDAELNFLCIDGGVIDNEPLNLARRILDGEKYFAPSTRGDRVDRALIAIAPFPDLPTFTVPPPETIAPFLLRVLAGALAGVINQARFDPKFAIEERDPEAFHRFSITPRRDVPPPEARTRAHLACSSVGGFGGFLCEDFRAHDFQLGRRNCQQFLRSVFALPDEEANRNPLFATGWTEAARDHYRIVEGPDGLERPRGSAVKGDKAYLPIIPLWGTAAEEVPLMDWPRYDPGQLDTLRGQSAKRLDAVIRRFIERDVHNPFRSLALRGARKFLVGRVAESLVRTIAEDLTARGLIR